MRSAPASPSPSTSGSRSHATSWTSVTLMPRTLRGDGGSARFPADCEVFSARRLDFAARRAIRSSQTRNRAAESEARGWKARHREAGAPFAERPGGRYLRRLGPASPSLMARSCRGIRASGPSACSCAPGARPRTSTRQRAVAAGGRDARHARRPRPPAPAHPAPFARDGAGKVAGMRRSTDRILTTHTGSLPRPPELLAELMRRDRGEPVDADALDARVREAVADVVRRQAEAGVAVVNDGEAGKIGYSTYVTERLDGFGGEADPPGPPPDMADFPEYQRRYSGDGGGGPAMPACDGPGAYRDTAAVGADLEAPGARRGGGGGGAGAAGGRGAGRLPRRGGGGRGHRRGGGGARRHGRGGGVPERGAAGGGCFLPPRPPLRRPRGVPLRDRRRDE